MAAWRFQATHVAEYWWMRRIWQISVLLAAALMSLAMAEAKPPKGEIPWSFQPLRAVEPPSVKRTEWPRDPVDRFVLARLEQAGIEPRADTDRYTLLRRLTFDLTGLPPTEAEIAAFVDDPSDDDTALATVVDRLLASERFGERWARHWLDVARYSDSVGRTWNAPFTYAWRYRDWVIDALNADLPYDDFIRQQLAGDLLPAADDGQHRRQIIATGFLTLGAMDLGDGRSEGFRLDQIDEQIDVTTRAFLGLTIACARCHDHKYDPITMRDYYALAGILYSTQTCTGQAHKGDLGPNMYVDPDRLIQLPSVGELAPSDSPAIHSMEDVRRYGQPSRPAPRYTLDPDAAMGVWDGTPRDCALCIAGDPYQRGEAPPRGEIRIPGLPGLPPIPDDASGRLELAEWIVVPDNPLTSRVLVNRVWQHLFGRGVVATVDDFGATGTPPTHPELLDYLARSFDAQGRSVKRLIRTLVLTRTYRQSSGGDPGDDPADELYGRMSLRRLEMEPLRDAMLFIAGRLETERPWPMQVAGTGGKGQQGITRSLLEIDAPYRSIYLPVLRSLLPPLYETFDFPDPTQLKGEREVTTVAPQALFLLNSDFAARCAEQIAERLLSDSSNEVYRIDRAYLQLLGRPPTADEAARSVSLLAALDGQGDVYRWSVLVQALMATAEFRYLR